MMGEELKPCPFCGFDEVVVRGNELRGWYCECPQCWGGVKDHCDSESSAAEDWNTRPVEDALRAENAALKAGVPYADIDYCAEASKVALPDKAQRVWNWLDACGWIGLEAYDEPEPHPTTEQFNALVELIRRA